MLKFLDLKVDYQDFMVFFTFLFFWISIQFGQLVEDSIAYTMVLSLGIIHGANDLLILKKKEANNRRFTKSITGYFILILTCIVGFLINPFFSMVVFIVISSYHFGEEHFEKKITGPILFESLIYTSYGLIIFMLIFAENLEDVDQIMYDLTGRSFSPELISINLIISSVVLITAFLYGYFKKCQIRLQIVKEFFYLIVLYLVFRTSSLILGFAVYFIFWHSLPSIINQTKYLSGNVDRKNIIKYFKTAGTIWLLSIGFLVTTYYLVDKNLFNSIIFLVLFAITTPHVWVIYRMKKS